MDDQLVIAAVAAHRSLYDPSHIKYKDVELRNAIWQKIAGDLKMEVELCKAKWRTLRDGFTRALRHQREARTVFPSKAKKPWRYQAEMEFLIPFIYTRESRSNQPEKDVEEEEHDILTQTTSPATDGSGYHASGDNEDNESTLSMASNTTGTDPPPLQPMNLMNNVQTPASLKRKLKPVGSGDVVDYLNCRRLELDTLLKERELSSPKVAHCQCRGPTEDPTEAFFFSMGQSVKRLPFYLQAQVKMKVCQLVTDAEMECLDSASIR